MNKEELERYVKTSINNCLKKMAEESEDFFDNYKLQKKYNKIIKENYNLKQVLNEIRELASNNSNYSGGDFEAGVFQEDILQIIDKAIGDDSNESIA